MVKNVRALHPPRAAADLLDIGINDDCYVCIAPEIAATETVEVLDRRNLLAFPGCVDAHMHTGIYRPPDQDAASESKAAAKGGLTSSLNFVRTGRYYLNRGGPYWEFIPAALTQGRFFVDYGFHIALIESTFID